MGPWSDKQRLIAVVILFDVLVAIFAVFYFRNKWTIEAVKSPAEQKVVLYSKATNVPRRRRSARHGLAGGETAARGSRRAARA